MTGTTMSDERAVDLAIRLAEGGRFRDLYMTSWEEVVKRGDGLHHVDVLAGFVEAVLARLAEDLGRRPPLDLVPTPGDLENEIPDGLMTTFWEAIVDEAVASNGAR